MNLDLGVTAEDLAWQEQASCAQSDPEAWFPEAGSSNATARRVCEQCPVVSMCREWAIATHQQYGMWGGLTEQELRWVQAGRPLRKTAAQKLAERNAKIAADHRDGVTVPQLSDRYGLGVKTIRRALLAELGKAAA